MENPTANLKPIEPRRVAGGWRFAVRSAGLLLLVGWIALVPMRLQAAEAAAGDVPSKGVLSVAPNMVELVLKPGETYSGYVIADNLGSVPLSVDAYLGDWTHTQSGLLFKDEINTHPRSLGKWMRLSPPQLTITPGGSKRVYYTVTVPPDPGLAGSYWGVLFIGQSPASALPRPSVKEPDRQFNLGLRILMRFAVVIYVTIADTGVRKANFVSTQVKSDEGSLTISATLANEGNTYLRPPTWLELRDQTGMTVYSVDHRELTVLPESKRDFTFELRGLNLAPGHYTALIIADYDGPNLIAAQAEIAIKEK